MTLQRAVLLTSHITNRDGIGSSNWLWLFAAVVTTAVVVAIVPGAAHAGPRIVVAPKADQKVKGSPVRVSVRAAWKARKLRVRLNGRSLSPEFRRAPIRKHHIRTVRVSASHGLRYGKNVLRVSRKRFGRKRKRDKVTFSVPRHRPLVGAGRDRRVEVGRPVQLNGRASRARNAPRGGAARKATPPGTPAGLKMRWRLVRKPAGSKAKLRNFADGNQPADDDLTGTENPVAQPARPRIKLDKPGRYVSKLVVTDRGVRSVADRVVTTALVGTPLVPVDTAATVHGQQGIAVGYHPAEQGGRAPNGPNERFFPLGDGDLLQLVVLDRRSLETVDSWSGPASGQSIAELTSRLKQYEDNRLAIVTAWCHLSGPPDSRGCDQWWKFHIDGATQKLVNTPGQGVNLIGGTRRSPAQLQCCTLENGDQLSWIGVPGFSPGDAWEAEGPEVPASLDGFLSPDSNENYAYMGTSPTTFDLGPDGQSVSMTLGPSEFSGSLPNGEGGFLVAYLVATTLSPAEFIGVPNGGNAVYTTRNADGSPNYSGMEQMADDLDTAVNFGFPMVVAIRSIGPAPLARMGLQPPNYQGSFDQHYANDLNTLANRGSLLGGTGQLIWGMATTPSGADSYSLVGSNVSAIEGVAVEGSGADLGSQLRPEGQTRLAGILARDKQSRYVPKVAANEEVGGALAELAVAEPTEWPHSSTPGEQAALQCIGQAQGLGPDPRVAYWLQSYKEALWLQKKDEIAQMQPSACPDVDATDFTTVRDELVTEIGWLINVNSYTDALTQPFTDDGLSSFADLNAITQDVIGDVSAAKGNNVGIDGTAIFADILDLLSEFEVPGVGAIAGAFFLIDDVTAASDDGPTIDWGQRVEAASAKIGEELAGQLQGIADGNEKLADIIAADYAKLSTVGRLGQCTPGESGCTPEWQFTQPQQNAASRMYKITAKREIWGGVLPAGYPFVLYTSSNPGSYHGDFDGPQEQISGIGCEFYPPFYVQEPVFLRYGIRQVANTPFFVFAQNNSHHPFGTNLDKQGQYYPSASLLNPLFAPLDQGGDPDKGGLGLDQYRFMIDNWSPPGIAGGGPARAAWVGC